MDWHLLYRMVLLRLKFFDKRDDFDFDIVNFPFWMVLFLVRHPVMFIFLNLFVLLECPVVSVTLVLGVGF